MRRGGSVSGAVSLVMIFCVLCLVVFSTLTYVTADRERQLAALSADRVADYYAADAEATRIVAALIRGEEPVTDVEVTQEMNWEDDSVLYSFCVSAGGEQELSVRVRLNLNGTYDILSWSTAYAGDWETNDTIEIWDGDF